MIDHSGISRRHALIEWKRYDYWLVDQDSLNGTFVNGRRVTDRVRLRHGDQLRFHDVEFRFAMPGMELADETIMMDGALPQALRLLPGKSELELPSERAATEKKATRPGRENPTLRSAEEGGEVPRKSDQPEFESEAETSVSSRRGAAANESTTDATTPSERAIREALKDYFQRE